MSTTRPAISLFTGAGGLDVGLEKAGFGVSLCVESDPTCRETIRRNHRWKLSEPGDIHGLNGPTDLLRQATLRRGRVTLLAGGPPCQPWSKSSFWAKNGAARLNDPRARTLHEYMRAVENVLPEVLLMENVSGLTYESDGVQLIHRRLRQINRKHGTRYELQVIRINAADYGVPQLRERVFLVAHVGGNHLELPMPSHGPNAPEPHRTAWDAIGHLDSSKWCSTLAITGKWAELVPSIPEGRNYLWHTPREEGDNLFGWRTKYWSFLLKLAKRSPSWTLQAKPGPATGPFHWRSRHLSVDELCALQTFPPGYNLAGDFRAARQQLGNAVPCALGELFGLAIRRDLLGESRVRRKLRLIPTAADDCPRAHPRRPVPRKYWSLRANHPDHPGEHLGPGKK